MWRTGSISTLLLFSRARIDIYGATEIKKMNSLLWRWLARASMNWILFAQKFIFSVQSLFWPTSKHTICNDNIIRWFATCLQSWKKKKRKQKSYSLILSSSCADCHSMFASIHFVSMFFLRSHSSQREMNINKYGMRHAKSTTTKKKKNVCNYFQGSYCLSSLCRHTAFRIRTNLLFKQNAFARFWKCNFDDCVWRKKKRSYGRRASSVGMK